MRYRIITIVILLLIGLKLFGQQQKTVPMTVQPQKTEVQILEESIMQLQEENQALQKQLKMMEKEMELYRGDVRSKIAELDAEQSRWTAWICLIVTLLAGGLGIVVPLVINNRNDAHLKEQVLVATEKAEKAEKSLADIEELKVHISKIEDKIIKDTMVAEEAAKEAKASQLFSQAMAEKEKNRDHALELFSQVITLKPDFADAYNNRGVLKMRKGDKIGAYADFEKVIELDPNDPVAYSNRGALKIEFKDFKSALMDFEKALELRPNDSASLNNKACVLLEMGEYAKALDIINDVLIIDDDVYVYWNTKGEICMRMENYEGADFAFTKAIALNPNDLESYKKRAICYRKMVELENDNMKKAGYLAKAMADEQKLIQFN